MEGNLHFKIDWASFIVGGKFTVFALFYFVFEGNFQVEAPGGLYLGGRFNGGFLRYEFGGLIHGGAYFRNFKVSLLHQNTVQRSFFPIQSYSKNTLGKNAPKGARKN